MTIIIIDSWFRELRIELCIYLFCFELTISYLLQGGKAIGRERVRKQRQGGSAKVPVNISLNFILTDRGECHCSDYFL